LSVEEADKKTRESKLRQRILMFEMEQVKSKDDYDQNSRLINQNNILSHEIVYLKRQNRTNDTNIYTNLKNLVSTLEHRLESITGDYKKSLELFSNTESEIGEIKTNYLKQRLLLDNALNKINQYEANDRIKISELRRTIENDLLYKFNNRDDEIKKYFNNQIMKYITGDQDNVIILGREICALELNNITLQSNIEQLSKELENAILSNNHLNELNKELQDN
jgi:hypothetical protein